MSDAGPPVIDSQEPADAPVEASRPRKRPSMMADPVVRALALVAMGLVLLFLVTVLGILLSGVTAPRGPRTLTENELSVAAEAVRSGKADAETWGRYIAALVANRRYGQARSVLKNAKESIDDSGTAALAVAEVRLLNAQEDYKQAIVVANKAQKSASAVLKRKLEGGGQAALSAKLDGLPDNWFILSLLKAEAYEELGEWDRVVKELDDYIKENPQAADILVWRGTAKNETGDTEGAEKDFKKALTFVPTDKAAREGLEKIGASENE